MMAVSMVYPELNREERHKKVLGVWKALSGGPDAPIGYDDATYKSESGTADRNWCLAYVYESPPLIHCACGWQLENIGDYTWNGASRQCHLTSVYQHATSTNVC